MMTISKSIFLKTHIIAVVLLLNACANNHHTSVNSGSTENSLSLIANLSTEQKTQIQQALNDTNKLRAEVGVPPLELDETLQAYAQKRSEELAQKFSHTRPNGNNALDNLTGISNIYGENIAGGSPSADQTVLQQWRHSPGHYNNMINPRFKKIGIGYSVVPNSGLHYYWTQIFTGDIYN